MTGNDARERIPIVLALLLPVLKELPRSDPHETQKHEEKQSLTADAGMYGGCHVHIKAHFNRNACHTAQAPRAEPQAPAKLEGPRRVTSHRTRYHSP